MAEWSPDTTESFWPESGAIIFRLTEIHGRMVSLPAVLMEPRKEAEHFDIEKD